MQGIMSTHKNSDNARIYIDNLNKIANDTTLSYRDRVEAVVEKVMFRKNNKPDLMTYDRPKTD